MASSLQILNKQQVKRSGYKITIKAHPLFWIVPFLLYCIIFTHFSPRHITYSIRSYFVLESFLRSLM